jgi:hypothetical protein
MRTPSVSAQTTQAEVGSAPRATANVARPIPDGAGHHGYGDQLQRQIEHLTMTTVADSGHSNCATMERREWTKLGTNAALSVLAPEVLALVPGFFSNGRSQPGPALSTIATALERR